MDKNISLLAQQLKQQIINKINNNNFLPPVLIYYIIKDIYEQVETTYQNYLLNIKTQSEQEDKNK